MRNDRPLTLVSMNATVRVARPAPPKSVTMDSPAAEVMTDLRFKQPAIVDEQLSMDAAHAHMIQQGVRLLLVLNRERSLSGILTATDIAGERPLRLAEERRIRHADILVSDIMTPLDKLEAVTLSELQHARVGNVVATLALTGRQHALVVDADKEGRMQVCGLLSRSQVERQLGIRLPAGDAARTFAEIEAALAST